MYIAPPYPEADVHDANTTCVRECVPLVGRDVNSNTLPFPLSLAIFSKVLCSETVREEASRERRGVLVVVRVRSADEEIVMSVSVSVPYETLTSEKPRANVAVMLMINVLNVRSVSEAVNMCEPMDV